jgi:hypothetical protein
VIPQHYQQIFEQFSAYSMIAGNPAVFYENMLVVDHFASQVQGNIVECGTWRGGMACAMMALGGAHRHYHFFDSFEGLPAAKERDGESAITYQRNTDSPAYRDNCRADYNDFVNLVNSQNIPEHLIHIYKGWFDTTLLAYKGEPISVLRLDGDWYDSTLTCLQVLYPHVAYGGVVIVDDYEAWDGCSRAVHDYLHSIDSRSRIDHTPLAHVTFIQKLD